MKYKSPAETCFCYLSRGTTPGETPRLISSAYKTWWEFRHWLLRGQVYTLLLLNLHLQTEQFACGCSTKRAVKGSCLIAHLTTGHFCFHGFALTMRHRRWARTPCAKNITTILAREKSPPGTRLTHS